MDIFKHFILIFKASKKISWDTALDKTFLAVPDQYFMIYYFQVYSPFKKINLYFFKKVIHPHPIRRDFVFYNSYVTL